MPFPHIFRSTKKDSDSVKGALLGKKKEKKNSSTSGNYLASREIERRTITDAPTPKIQDMSTDDQKKEAKQEDKAKEQSHSEEGQKQMDETTKVEESVKGKQPQREGGIKDTTEQKAHQTEKIYETELKGSFSKIWNHVKGHRFNEVKLKGTSFYTPNAYSLIELLMSTHECLYKNEYQAWEYKDYMSFPVTIYYCVLYYIRIAHVLEINNELPREIGTGLRDFFRKYNPSELPIAGPFHPFFEALAGYESEDDRLTKLLPSLPIPGNSVGCEITFEDFILTQPHIPMLIHYWTKYTKESYANMTRTNHEVNNRWVPFKFPVTRNTYLGGIRFNQNRPDEAHRFEEGEALSSLGLDNAHPENWAAFDRNHDYWTRSKFGQAKFWFDTTRDGAPMQPDTSYTTFSTFIHFLCLDKGASWFSECVRLAEIHAKYFTDPIFFKDLVWSTGPQVNIRTNLFVNEAVSTQTRTIYEIPEETDAGEKTFVVWTNDDEDNDHRTWFPQLKQSYTGKLNVVENNVMQVERYGARFFMLNGPVQFFIRKSTTAASVTALSGNNYFNGPYFEGFEYRTRDMTRAINVQVFGTHSYSGDHFTCFDRLYDLITKEFYVAKGQ